MNRPCGVAIDFEELFGSEGKGQVYGHLHNVLEKENMHETANLCVKICICM